MRIKEVHVYLSATALTCIRELWPGFDSNKVFDIRCNISNGYLENGTVGGDGHICGGGGMYYYVSSERTALVVCSEKLEFKIILLYVLLPFKL